MAQPRPQYHPIVEPSPTLWSDLRERMSALSESDEQQLLGTALDLYTRLRPEMQQWTAARDVVLRHVRENGSLARRESPVGMLDLLIWNSRRPDGVQVLSPAMVSKALAYLRGYMPETVLQEAQVERAAEHLVKDPASRPAVERISRAAKQADLGKLGPLVVLVALWMLVLYWMPQDDPRTANTIAMMALAYAVMKDIYRKKD
jgi:hypothetical protein